MQKVIGFLGLGNMGLNMVYKLLDEGYQVYAWNRGEAPRLAAQKAGAKVFATIPELIAAMPIAPKIIWSMVAAGDPVDLVIKQCLSATDQKSRLNRGDIFVDGVNSYFADTLRRGDELEQKGIYFMDCGVSGGVDGARQGACIMAGGDQKGWQIIEPIVEALAQKDGYGYFGKRGAGHYVKMVHNAIEYGMMQSIAEGIHLLETKDFEIDYQKLTSVWNKGSIIQGNLMGFLNQAYQQSADLKSFPVEIGSLGTGRWAVEEALKQGVPFGSITNSVFARYQSKVKDSPAFRVVSALRAIFGAHTADEKPYN